MNILLVEPDYILSSVYSEALTVGNHSVTTKTNAQDAVDAMNSTTFDLIVLEIQMAEHNGLELLHELRSYNEWQKVPVIILTMTPKSSFQVEEGLFKSLGIEDYLYKPVTSVDKLLSSIDRLSSEKIWTK